MRLFISALAVSVLVAFATPNSGVAEWGEDDPLVSSIIVVADAANATKGCSCFKIDCKPEIKSCTCSCKDDETPTCTCGKCVDGKAQSQSSCKCVK